MKNLIFVLLLTIICGPLYGWGQTGHRVVGEIASSHVNSKAARKIKLILGHETLAEVSTYMDFIKSDKNFDFMNPWHYATIPDGEDYQGAPPDGDAIHTINRIIAELKSGSFTYGDEAFNLKCLVHLIGDIHMPLHVGNGLDRGGNDVRVEYFGEQSNLHRVWDSDIIDSQQLSYTEYATWINHVEASQKEIWQNSLPMDWAQESKYYRDQAYVLPDNLRLYYRYNFDNIELINLRLLQAGVRLAAILNEIYG